MVPPSGDLLMTIGKRGRYTGRRDADRKVRRAAGFLLPALATIPAAAAMPAVERISRTDIPAYIDADGSATGPFAVSANGRFVVFALEAGNLVVGDGKRDLICRPTAAASSSVRHAAISIRTTATARSPTCS